MADIKSRRRISLRTITHDLSAAAATETCNIVPGASCGCRQVLTTYQLWQSGRFQPQSAWLGTWTGEMPANVGTARKAFGGAKEAASADSDKPSPETISFNQKKMRNQQIGVLNDEPSGNMGTAKDLAPAPQDPIQFTQSKLCPFK